MAHNGPFVAMSHSGSLQSRPILGHSLQMAATDPHFKIRLPEWLKARLDEAAKEAGRSLTSEIVLRLRQSVDTLDDLMLANRTAELTQAGRDLRDARMRLEDAEDNPGAPEDLKAVLRLAVEVEEARYLACKARLDDLASSIERHLVGKGKVSADNAQK
ncbi:MULTISPECIES: Arc family DNA-binding protein [Stenotrophomonas]|uniref:Arc family DNA-binding protein n=1 Tax=Stenotrophomonas TaxID=40323 RepID=UPI002E790154|nr:Arc family DNA-binding protein [Stenotrophomonas sp. SMYL28]